jgi:hypothetical protein
MNLSGDARLALDPCLFFERVVGSPPDLFQRELLTSLEPRELACCGRGTGKSTAIAASAAHQILYSPGSLVIVGSPALQNSQELGRKIFEFVKTVQPEVKSENLSRIELLNRSRCICLPASESTRGLHGCELLILEEAQLIEPSMWSVLLPFQATAKAPRLRVLGTPRAKIGRFWECYNGGNFKTLRVKSSECSRITPEFLAQQLATIGLHEYSMEYDAEFSDPSTALVGYDLIARGFDDGAVWI